MVERFSEQDIKNAYKYLEGAVIEVQEDKIIASGNIDSTNGKCVWGIAVIVSEALRDTDISILHTHGDNKVAGSNKLWTTLRGKNTHRPHFLTEAEVQLIKSRINELNQ
jgi:hypothetical protein